LTILSIRCCFGGGLGLRLWTFLEAIRASWGKTECGESAY